MTSSPERFGAQQAVGSEIFNAEGFCPAARFRCGSHRANLRWHAGSRRVLMTPYRRLIMLACMADNPGADPEALRREFICRVLSDHPMAACRILGQYGTQLQTRLHEPTARTGQGKRRQKFFEQRVRRAEAYRAELLRRTEF
jgi:hypothetical protein